MLSRIEISAALSNGTIDDVAYCLATIQNVTDRQTNDSATVCTIS